MMRMPSNTAILLLAHGTPDKPEEVPEYLRLVTGGRELPEPVVAEIRSRYVQIGRSPLTGITLRQAAALERQMQLPVFVGMRNWHPFIAGVVEKMADEGVTNAVAICMAPQDSRTSVGLYRRAVLEAAAGRIEIDFVDSWHDHQALIAAFAEKLREALSRAQRETSAERKTKASPVVIFTAHSVPARTVAPDASDAASDAASGAGDRGGDPYAQQVRETAALVAKAVPELPAGKIRFAFQSQGASGGPWLGPTVEETLTQLAARAEQHVVIQPIGFVCDHVEVLYDIDIAFQRLAATLGMRMWRAESLNESSALIQALADIATRRLPLSQSARVRKDG